MHALTLPVQTKAPSLVADAEIAFDQILQLASLARALDPSLPPSLRFFQRGPSDAAERAGTPGRVVLTFDERDSMENGLQDSHAIDLFEALDRVLPPLLSSALRERVEAAVPGPAGAVAQAFAAVHKTGRVLLDMQPTNDDGVSISMSPPLRPAALAFRDDPFLSDVAAVALVRPRIAGEEDPAFDFVNALNSARNALGEDVTRLSVPRVQQVIATIRSLDGKHGESSYEERSHQGWIAYSLLAGGKGWTRPLLAGDTRGSISPYTAFRGVSPVVAALAANDAPAVQALLDAGVSPHAVLAEAPPVFAPDVQAHVRAETGNYAPLTVFGAACGSTEAVARLVQAGADPSLRNGAGESGLDVALRSRNDALVRVLTAKTPGLVDPPSAEGFAEQWPRSAPSPKLPGR